MKILILLMLSLLTLGSAQQYKLCVYPQHYTRCDELNKNGQVQCIRVIDSVDCALKLTKGEVDFGAFSPEQVHLVSEKLNDNNVIISELRAKEWETRNNSFQMVVVVKNDYSGGLANLKGKKYCHPGFKYHEKWTPRVRKSFENVLFKNQVEQSCDKEEKETYVERELKVISEYFGDSCRPGPWTYDAKLEEQLKRKYSNLCKLCDSDCSYSGSQERNSLRCMTEKNGDVAFTTLEAANTLSKANYKLLCPNGETQDISLNMKNDCHWHNQPWPLIIGRKEKAQEIQTGLRQWIGPEYIAITQGASPFVGPNRQPWQETVAFILSNNKENLLNILSSPESIITFLGRKSQKLEINTNADCPMRWCTISQDEQEKCDWVARASLYAGVEPQISCIQGQNIYDCLKKIRDNNVDIIAIDSNYGYLARKISLHNVLYSENSANDIATVIAVLADNVNVEKFSDLKGKKACFPEYRGLAWLSFIEAARSQKLIPNNCDFGKSVSEFFDGACAPGATDDNHYRNRNENYVKLCSVCSDNCNSHEANPFYNNKGALSCLEKQVAEVAFVEREALDLPASNNYKVLCADGTVSTINEMNLETCPLSRTVDSEVISRNNDSRKIEYKHALLLMNDLFGTAFKNEYTISMFKEFKGLENLLFKKNVLGLDDDSSDNPYVQNYIKLFEKADKCSGSIVISASSITILISAIVLLFTRHA